MPPIPFDKFGRSIDSKTFEQMMIYAQGLNAKGYSEIKEEPNRYYKEIFEGMLFADLRGNEAVPLWEDARPWLTWKFNDDIPMWKRRRIIKKEMENLHMIGCPLKLLSKDFRTGEFESTGHYINEEKSLIECQNGYCLFCHMDMESDQTFCSDVCEKNYADSFKNSCEICGKKIDLIEEIPHHINYSENIKMNICRSCHAKIHLTYDPAFEQFKPVDKRITKEKKYRLIPCGSCNGKARVLIEDYKEGIPYFCTKCSQKAKRKAQRMKDYEFGLAFNNQHKGWF